VVFVVVFGHHGGRFVFIKTTASLLTYVDGTVGWHVGRYPMEYLRWLSSCRSVDPVVVFGRRRRRLY